MDVLVYKFCIQHTTVQPYDQKRFQLLLKFLDIENIVDPQYNPNDSQRGRLIKVRIIINMLKDFLLFATLQSTLLWMRVCLVYRKEGSCSNSILEQREQDLV